MEAPLEPADEVARLRGCLNDLIGIMALPALWPGREPLQILDPLVDALVEMLRLAFVVVLLTDAGGGQPLEIVRIGESCEGTIRKRDIRAAIAPSLGSAASGGPLREPVFVGDVGFSVAAAHLGVFGELGIVLAVSENDDFPSQTERLLLDVAANQAAIGLQQAHLLRHQRRVSEELDSRVAHRTSELAATNQRLEKEVGERRRAEDALRASEGNLRLTIDTIPVLAWSARPDGSAEFFNKHYLDFIGLSAAEASGWGWTSAVQANDENGFAATWRGIVASQEPGETEARLRRHDGEYRWFLFRASPLRDQAGTIVKWYGVNTDIEDRKRAEAELRNAHDSFADAQRLSKTGSFITDLVGDDHNWSAEALRIFEFDPGSKVTVQRVRDVIHPDDLPEFESVLSRGATGIDVNFAFRIVPGSGALKHVRGVAHVIDRVPGRPTFVGAVQDVTETKVAEDALNSAGAELARVSRVTTLGALTASIAHEVNQPLSGIITNAGTCLRMLDADPPNLEGARETARRTIRDGNRAADVIARLRALFSKSEFTPERLDLSEAAREVVALSSSDLQTKPHCPGGGVRR